MPLDSRDKRSSAINISSPWRGMLPTPDGAALNQGDRQQVALMYRGIAAAAPEVVTATATDWLVRARRRGIR